MEDSERRERINDSTTIDPTNGISLHTTMINSLADVPEVAITVTIPALFGVPRLILSVPGPRKA